MKKILCNCVFCMKLQENLRASIDLPETGPVTVVEGAADFSEAQHLFRITPELIRQHNPYKMDCADACSFFDLYRRDFDAVFSNALADFVRSKMSPQLRYIPYVPKVTEPLDSIEYIEPDEAIPPAGRRC